jgi:hypothetical protein
MTARAVLIAWAQSEGFAAVHNGAATDERIVDDLLAYLLERGFEVVERDAVRGEDRRIGELATALDDPIESKRRI